MPGIEVQVRPVDCDSFGHINNSAYVSYIQLVLARSLDRFGFVDDWRPEGDHFWMPRLLEIEYRQPARFGDQLAALLWLMEPDPLCPMFGIEIRHACDGAGDAGDAVMRARSAWSRCTRQSGQAVPLPKTLLAQLPCEAGILPRPFALPPDSPDFRRYHWDHRVVRAEVGPGGRAHPQMVYRWLEDALFDASAQGGWPTERRLATGAIALMTRHDGQILALPVVGEEIRITSRIVEVRRLRGTWLHDIHGLPGGDLLLSDYSTGIFLDLTGRPAAPPAEMIQELQFG